jgi:hypothetical protein
VEKFVKNHRILAWQDMDIRGLFTLMPFSTLPKFGKVANKVATFSLLPNFGKYIRNPASCQNFGNYAKIW